MLDILKVGKAAARRLTVPEGLTIEETASLVSERLGVARDSVLAAARDGAAASAVLGYPVRSFEGFLRPETYTLPLVIGAVEIVRLMADGFRNDWKPEWNAQLESLGMTQLQLVTLASIVEGEARVDDERETIAGVYHNRLRIGTRAASRLLRLGGGGCGRRHGQQSDEEVFEYRCLRRRRTGRRSRWTLEADGRIYFADIGTRRVTSQLDGSAARRRSRAGPGRRSASRGA